VKERTYWQIRKRVLTVPFLNFYGLSSLEGNVLNSGEKNIKKCIHKYSRSVMRDLTSKCSLQVGFVNEKLKVKLKIMSHHKWKY